MIIQPTHTCTIYLLHTNLPKVMSCVTVSSRDTTTVCVNVRIDGECPDVFETGFGVFVKFSLSPDNFRVGGSMGAGDLCFNGSSSGFLLKRRALCVRRSVFTG
ncbi:hypothetical protein GWI33_008359 [Rhynchophorus ferrugineus]|uniref:Uncharacterized protein n=1 Tax=Rhynchophorus ferrugineus TaxID=354439 RepID=A0A834IVU1_RHYFE|nr:hypothetical protein GWI33_008359 [Rhynchophorus ferrugineus]